MFPGLGVHSAPQIPRSGGRAYGGLVRSPLLHSRNRPVTLRTCECQYDSSCCPSITVCLVAVATALDSCLVVAFVTPAPSPCRRRITCFAIITHKKHPVHAMSVSLCHPPPKKARPPRRPGSATPAQDVAASGKLSLEDHFGDQGRATLSSHDIIRPTFAFLLMECERRIPGRPIRCPALCVATVSSGMTVFLPAALGRCTGVCLAWQTSHAI